jgi:hypothetical protein
MYCTSIHSFYKCLQAFYFGPRKDENVKWSWIYHCGKVNFVLWAAFRKGRIVHCKVCKFISRINTTDFLLPVIEVIFDLTK